MMQLSRRHASGRSLWPSALLAAAALTLACDGPTITVPKIDPWAPGQIGLSMVSGNNQAGTVGRPLAAPFVVRVVDQRGGSVAGAVT